MRVTVPGATAPSVCPPFPSREGRGRDGVAHAAGRQTKASTVLVRALLNSIARFGKLKAVRTDNETVFCSWVFLLSLFILGIRHQRTQIHSPWQNGRVERFFGTLKRMAERVMFENRSSVAQAMDSFRFWYDQVRPHQSLGGRNTGGRLEQG